MNYLSVQNTFMKPHNNHSFLLSEAPQKNSYLSDTRPQLTENNNQINSNGNDKKIQEVWSKHNFDMNKVKVEQIINFNNVKTTWALQDIEEEEPVPENAIISEESEEGSQFEEVQQEAVSADVTPEKEDTSPSHHARRPPNAFLIFCKKHRPIVRQRFQNLENRGVTKILGEWWALLETNEKQPYNDLAKEYKDAFLSANPDFRWYKLPAPPLRTLTTRPTTVPKVSVPLSSPSSNNYLSEFTPGKLADESQLGGLTSLMNNNFASAAPKTECCKNKFKISDYYSNENNKMDKKCETEHLSPTKIIKPSLPPKPIKKRIFEQYIDSKNCSMNILPDVEQNEQDSNNMTNQDLLNKVVDGIFAKESEKIDQQEARKTERMCKGKRYERFMVEGKLLGNKRDTKLTQHKQCKIETKIENELNTIIKPEAPKLDLGNTIKRLAERTNIKLDYGNQNNESTQPLERVRSISETSDTAPKNSPAANFNLDLRISNLPSLSYDQFMVRKKDSKKRKIRSKTDAESKSKMLKLEKQPVGSKKRKNKQSITHLNKSDEEINSDLLGLATLAMVAANTEKINEKILE